MNPLGVSRLDHCSVLITDVARARHFYGTVLGLPEVPAPRTFDFVALWYDLGGGQTLHLLQKPVPDTVSPRHFALHVADVPAARRYLREAGVPFEETVEIPHCDRVFVRDPDGNRIELIQWRRPYNSDVDGRFLV